MPALQLDTSVRFVRGVGPARCAALAAEGIQSVFDLLHVCPIRYECLPRSKPLAELQPGEQACITGEIIRVRLGRGHGRVSVRADVHDGSETCRIVWFNSPYLRSQLRPGLGIRATGKIQLTDDRPQMINPIFRLFMSPEEVEAPTQDTWQPVYPTTGGISPRALRKILSACLDDVALPSDYLPVELRKKRELIPLPDAFRQLHRPDSTDSAAQARIRLAYDELLSTQMAFAQARKTRQSDCRSTALALTPGIDERIRRRLPFSLTAAQDRACREICDDLARKKPMFRLLQGDVGSGKTAVAVYAALVAIAHKHQIALLAPTQILARQHFEKINRYLEGSAVRVRLATGSSKETERRELRSALAAGEIDWIVGTHALLQKDVRFKKLGLVIIDEQHRFGVRQRRSLQAKGLAPHYLVLSATPIPRTQALALFGDLDMSIIDASPAGRGRVSSHLISRSGEREAWDCVRGELDRGRQAYIVYPRITEDGKLPLKSAVGEFDRLRKSELSAYRCAVLHGKMDGDAKSKIIDDFYSGKVQALISTTVIEVGVDVPNATVMAVFHAERYGLAQLHQLRGRVGRGAADAHFFMFADGAKQEVLKRLNVLLDTTDGFKIAEADLALRGPGELIGTRQHGLPTYRFANLATDLDLLYAAHQDAADVEAQRIRLQPGHRSVMQRLRKLHVNQKPGLLHVA